MEEISIQQESKQVKDTLVVLVDENSDYIIDWIKLNISNTKVMIVNRRSPIDTNPSYMPFIEVFGYDHDIHKRMHSFTKDKAHHIVKLLGTRLVDAGIPVEAYCLVGNQQEMLERVEELKPDFIVVGSRNTLKLLGSTSKFVLNEAKVPVMLIKQQ